MPCGAPRPRRSAGAFPCKDYEHAGGSEDLCPCGPLSCFDPFLPFPVGTRNRRNAPWSAVLPSKNRQTGAGIWANLAAPGGAQRTRPAILRQPWPPMWSATAGSPRRTRTAESYSGKIRPNGEQGQLGQATVSPRNSRGLRHSRNAKRSCIAWEGGRSRNGQRMAKPLRTGIR